MLKILQNIDRRWVFLSMLLAVAIPVLAKTVFPVNISPQTMMVFNAIEDLPEGSRILLSYDFDPASQGELLPMAQPLFHQGAQAILHGALATWSTNG
ncbi:MAG TPA: hypothetical protein EYO40_05470 [Phycisphaerales bacterium]|nr:hypothetical protein [Phycisphaerales bacterium]